MATSPTHSRNPFKRDEDPSILAAKKRVMAAEESEKAADKALLGARASVREAREEVRRLEREADDEYAIDFHVRGGRQSVLMCE